MLDLWLAVGHHLIVFALFGVLVAELVLVRRGITPEGVRKVAGIDNYYGILALAIVIVGLSRAVLAAKGWAYYSHNAFFWAKIATFVSIAALSALPTIRYIGWRRQAHAPSDAEIGRVRAFLYAELLLFAPLLAFAATMARGYGEFAR